MELFSNLMPAWLKDFPHPEMWNAYGPLFRGCIAFHMLLYECIKTYFNKSDTNAEQHFADHLAKVDFSQHMLHEVLDDL